MKQDEWKRRRKRRKMHRNKKGKEEKKQEQEQAERTEEVHKQEETEEGEGRGWTRRWRGGEEKWIETRRKGNRNRNRKMTMRDLRNAACTLISKWILIDTNDFFIQKNFSMCFGYMTKIIGHKQRRSPDRPQGLMSQANINKQRTEKSIKRVKHTN